MYFDFVDIEEKYIRNVDKLFYLYSLNPKLLQKQERPEPPDFLFYFQMTDEKYLTYSEFINKLI